MSEPRRVLWGAGTPRTLRPHWILHELELPYETRVVLPRSAAMDDPTFLALSPRHKVPLFEEGDLVIGESGAIVTYLADRHRESRDLIPLAGTPDRARHDQWCCFALMELDATALYVLRRHEGLPDVYGEAPAAATAAREYFARQVQVVAQAFDDGREYLLGARFTVADLLLVSCLSWANFVSIEVPASLAAYHARSTARPAYTKAMAANFPPEAVAMMKALAEGDSA